MSKLQVTFHTSISWRVLSTHGSSNSAGYWTSSYAHKQDAVQHADKLGGKAYEVTSEFMYQGTEIDVLVSETWRLLK